jgi:hypothetical protein
LSGYTYEGCVEFLMKYKFRGGQSSFAIKFWNEAMATENLSYVFNCPIVRVKDTSKIVEVTVEDGRNFRASRVVCTILLNVLSTINFDPPLGPAKRAAADFGQANQCVKVNVEVSNKELRSCSSTSKLVYAFGDGTTPAGNTHIVAFGADENHLDEPENDINGTKKHNYRANTYG